MKDISLLVFMCNCQFTVCSLGLLMVVHKAVGDLGSIQPAIL